MFVTWNQMNQQNFSRFYAEIPNSCNIFDIIGNNNVKKQWPQKHFLHDDWLLCSPGVQRLEHVMSFFTKEEKESFLFGRHRHGGGLLSFTVTHCMWFIGLLSGSHYFVSSETSMRNKIFVDPWNLSPFGPNVFRHCEDRTQMLLNKQNNAWNQKAKDSTC